MQIFVHTNKVRKMDNLLNLPHPSSHQDSNDIFNYMESEPDVNQTVETSNEDTSDTEPASYFHNRSLKYFASEPPRMVSHHKHLMELLLENNNPEAHYVEGINQFFFHQRSVEALNHLHNSANGKYNKGTYLCDLLLLCTGKKQRRKKYHGYPRLGTHTIYI
ncbi:hypothetical protein YC2023_060602 [Brassica napus]